MDVSARGLRCAGHPSGRFRRKINGSFVHSRAWAARPASPFFSYLVSSFVTFTAEKAAWFLPYFGGGLSFPSFICVNITNYLFELKCLLCFVYRIIISFTFFICLRLLLCFHLKYSQMRPEIVTFCFTLFLENHPALTVSDFSGARLLYRFKAEDIINTFKYLFCCLYI